MEGLVCTVQYIGFSWFGALDTGQGTIGKGFSEDNRRPFLLP